MGDFSKLRHDFINNSLRLEVLNKILVDKLEKEESWDSEEVKDLEQFLILQQDLVKQLKQYT